MEATPGGFSTVTTEQDGSSNTTSEASYSRRSEVQKTIVRWLSILFFYPISVIYYIIFASVKIKSLTKFLINRIYRNKHAGFSHESQFSYFLEQSLISDSNEMRHSYTQLSRDAVEGGKFQFVFLQSTLFLNHRELTSYVVKNLQPLLLKYSGLLWMGDMTTNTEALQVADMFNIKHCPALVVFYKDNDNTSNNNNNSRSSSKKFKLIFKLEGENRLKQEIESSSELEAAWAPQLKNKLNEHYSRVILYRPQQHQQQQE